MSRLTEVQIETLAELITEQLPEKLIHALIQADMCDKLSDLLKLLDMEDLISVDEQLDTFTNGMIVVIGDLAAKEKDLLGVAKTLGIRKDRFKFVDFQKSIKFDYKSLEWNSTIAAILIAAIPHKTAGSYNSSSAIAHMENNKDKYPKVIRMSANNMLKITKTNFKKTLKNLINNGVVTI